MTPDQPSQATPPPAAVATAEVEDLAPSVEMLEADPGNLWAWLRVAWRLHDDPDASGPDRTQARLALDNVSAALGEAGHLPMAIAACRKLATCGEERTAWARLMALAAAYGKTSSRLDARVRPKAPVPPRPSSGDSGKAPEPGAVLRARAVAALRKAAARAIAAQQLAAVQSRQLKEPLPPAPLLSALMPDAFVKLAQQLEVQELPTLARVFSAGEPGEALFIVARGTVRIEREDGTVLARLRGGAFFGEMALLTGARRSAHAVAETPLLLLRAPRAVLEELGDRDAQVAAALAGHARRRLLQNAMLTSQLFRVIDEGAQEEIMARFTFRRFEAGEVLIKDGEPGAELFVVLSGRAEVARRSAPGSAVLVPVATLGMGDVVGEMALLARRQTSALVHALEATTVLALRRDDFEQVVAAHPEVRQLLEQVAAQRQHGPEEEPPLHQPALLFGERSDVLV